MARRTVSRCGSLLSLFALAMTPAVWAGDGAANAESGGVERWQVNMPEGVTAVSAEIYELHMTIFWICVAIGVVVFGIMFYSMIAHRKSPDREPAKFHEHLGLEITWTVAAIVILVAMAFPATSTLYKIYDTSESELDIKITGWQWKWHYEYMGEEVGFFSNMSTPDAEIQNAKAKNKNYLLEVDNPLVIPAGKKVRFLVTAEDVIHSWWVPDFAVKRDAIPGFIREAWTKVDKPGIYRGQCAELCGALHGFMPVVVEVKPQEEFDVWLAEKKAAAAKERELAGKTFTLDELMARGEQVYSTACAGCHGANGEGGVGTKLKGSPIAVGPVEAHLDMVINGSASNPMMSAFGGQLSEVDTAAVITYERNAWGNSTGDLVQPIDVLNYKNK